MDTYTDCPNAAYVAVEDLVRGTPRPGDDPADVYDADFWTRQYGNEWLSHTRRSGRQDADRWLHNELKALTAVDHGALDEPTKLAGEPAGQLVGLCNVSSALLYADSQKTPLIKPHTSCITLLGK